jgi:hypothetical protein
VCSGCGKEFAYISDGKFLAGLYIPSLGDDLNDDHMESKVRLSSDDAQDRREVS